MTGIATVLAERFPRLGTLSAAWLAGGAAVAVGAVYVVAGRLVHGPSVFGDELVYFEAARSIAHDGSAAVRDGPYRFGPLYPLLLAPLVRAASSTSTAYDLVKLANAALFVSAAAPVYLLARRLLPGGWSAAVAVAAVAVPSSLYTPLVLTESLAYAASCWVLVAAACTLERPTPRNQAALVAALAGGVAARPQLVALAGSLAVAIPIRLALLRRAERPRARHASALWPLGIAAGALALVLASLALSGSWSSVSGLGGYRGLWRSYSFGGVLRWSWYSLADLALYLAFAPLVVAPAALAMLARRARRGAAPQAAFAALFSGVNVAMVALVGAFSSTSYGEGRLHDRYLFYVVPLWLVLLAVWARTADATRPLELLAGTTLALLLAATIPQSLLVRDGARQLDGVATALWSEAQALVDSRPAALRLLLVCAALAVAAAAAFLPARTRPLLALPVVAVFAVNAGIVWNLRVADASRPVFQPRTARELQWVDRAVRPPERVTTLYVASPECAAAARDALLWTEFFNGSVHAGAFVGGSPSHGVPAHEAHVRGDGVLVSDGAPLRASLVVSSAGVRLRGRELAVGTVARLRLWRVTGPVALVAARSDRELLARACPPGRQR